MEIEDFIKDYLSDTDEGLKSLVTFVYAHSFLTRVYKERLIHFCPPMTKLLLIHIAVRRKSRGVFHGEC